MGISPSRLEVKVLKQRERDSADALTRSMALKKEKERQLLQERLLGRKGLAPPSQIAPLPAIGGGSSPTPPPRDLQRLQSTNTIVKNLNKVETLKRTEEQSANKLKNHLSGKQEAVKANLQERLRLTMRTTTNQLAISMWMSRTTMRTAMNTRMWSRLIWMYRTMKTKILLQTSWSQ